MKMVLQAFQSHGNHQKMVAHGARLNQQRNQERSTLAKIGWQAGKSESICG